MAIKQNIEAQQRPEFYANLPYSLTIHPDYWPPFIVYSKHVRRFRVTIIQVDPNEYCDAISGQSSHWGLIDYRPHSPRGTSLYSEIVQVEEKTDVDLATTVVDIFAGLNSQEPGHYAIMLSVITTTNAQECPFPVECWIQSTRLFATIFSAYDRFSAFISTLDGLPVAGASITTNCTRQTANTDASGVATMTVNPPENNEYCVIAQLGNDVVVQCCSWSMVQQIEWRSSAGCKWYIVSDRKTYRPGDTAYIKGYIRFLSNAPDATLEISNRIKSLTFSPMQDDRPVSDKNRIHLDEFGGFELIYNVPHDSRWKGHRIDFVATLDDGRTFSHYFWIDISGQRTSTFIAEMQLKTLRDEKVYLGDDTLCVGVQTSQFTGQPIPDVRINYELSQSPTKFSPPYNPAFIFGYEDGEFDTYYSRDKSISRSFRGRTDKYGQHLLEITPNKRDLEGSEYWNIEAILTDPATQQLRESQTILVHSSPLYVGILRYEESVSVNESVDIKIVVTDIYGQRQANHPVDVTIRRNPRFDALHETASNPNFEDTVQLYSCQHPITHSFIGLEWGAYEITAVVTDPIGRKHVSQIQVTVFDSERAIGIREIRQDDIRLVPDKSVYNPGELAKITVETPFWPAHGLLLVRRQGVLYCENIQIDQATHILTVPITDVMVPNISVQLELVGLDTNCDGPSRPIHGTTAVDLIISTAEHSLDINIQPPIERPVPGQETHIDITVRDSNRTAISDCDITLFIIDEASLISGRNNIKDPISVFYDAVNTSLARNSSRDTLYAYVDDVKQLFHHYEKVKPLRIYGKPSSGDGSDLPIKPIANSAITQISTHWPTQFIPSQRTDEAGNVRVSYTVPNASTRFQYIVIAATKCNRFGYATKPIIVSKSVYLQASPPAYLREGDQPKLSINIINQTLERTSASISATVSKPLSVTEISSRRLEILPQGRESTLVDISVGSLSGDSSKSTAKIQFQLTSENGVNEHCLEIPIYRICSALNGCDSSRNRITRRITHPRKMKSFRVNHKGHLTVKHGDFVKIILEIHFDKNVYDYNLIDFLPACMEPLEIDHILGRKQYKDDTRLEGFRPHPARPWYDSCAVNQSGITISASHFGHKRQKVIYYAVAAHRGIFQAPPAQISFGNNSEISVISSPYTIEVI